MLHSSLLALLLLLLSTSLLRRLSAGSSLLLLPQELVRPIDSAASSVAKKMRREMPAASGRWLEWLEQATERKAVGKEGEG